MPYPQLPRRQAGFTLIEIAIVLVIIGLLLGGILKGQELITQGAGEKSISMTFVDDCRNQPVSGQAIAHCLGMMRVQQHAGLYTAPSGGTLRRWHHHWCLQLGNRTRDESRLFWLHLRPGRLSRRRCH